MFQPPSDSWMLAEQIEREPLRPRAAVLDLCTGSGVLAIAAARRGAHVVAVDISRRAMIAARVNAWLNGVSVRALRGDLFSPLAGRQFDLIVSNPPYVPSPPGRGRAVGAARAWDGGRDGRLFIDRICCEATRHLHPGGALLLVHSSVCREELTLDALSRAGLKGNVVGRRRGPLGPLMRARTEWLRREGMLSGPESEDLIVVRAERELPARTADFAHAEMRLRR